MAGAILAVNAGSSSLKFALYARDGGRLARRGRGEVEGIGAAAHLVARDEAGAVLAERRWEAGDGDTHEDYLRELFAIVDGAFGADQLAGAGHRVVHGGETLVEPVLVTPKTMRAMEALVPLAPLHQPHNLAPIRAVEAARPGLAQVACFDTAFHHALPPQAARLALPRALNDSGIRRYGFHGLSYEYLAGALRDRAPALASGRVVAAHLGNGASLCALRDGRSIETTMSFTALDGLVMGTRPGTLDPGVLLYLMQERGMDAAALEDLLYHRSGLLGVSGVSSDMRALTASDDPHAREAVSLFCYRAACQTGALAVALGGLDGIVFSGGIGEHAPAVRAGISEHLQWLGLRLDPGRNAQGDGRISADGCAVEAWVLPTDEEGVIARHTARLLHSRE